MRLFFNVLILLGLLSAASLEARAEAEIDYVNMEDEINREPWLSYQKLLAQESNIQASSVEERLWWLLRKAQAENLLYFHKDFTKTVDHAQTLVSSQTPIIIASMLNVFSGAIAQRQGRYADSVNMLEKGLLQAKKANLNHVYARGKQELAYTRSLTELYETSLVDLQEAYVEAFSLEDHFLIAVINETYGAIYGYMGEYEKSIDYYEKALDTYEPLGFRSHIAEATYGLASTYRYWKKYDLAIDKFTLYREQVSYTPNKDISFFGAYGLGMTLAEKGDCPAAIEVIDQALNLNGQIDYNAELYKRKADCLIDLNRLEQAEQALAEADAIFDGIAELDGTTWQLEVIKIRGKLAYHRQDYAKAYQLNRDYYQAYTEVLHNKSSARLFRVKSSMERERHGIEVALLQQRSKVQQLQVEREQQKNTQQRYIIILSVLIALVVFIALIVQWRNNKKIMALSVRDPLSGLFNRRHVFDVVDKLFEHLEPEKSELSMIMMDLDDFKQINDEYGHPFGDQVIREVARIGQATLRSEDVMGRIGGEEFLCVLPRTNIEKCHLIASRLRKNIEQFKFVNEAGDIVNITASLGIASVSTDCTDPGSLYVHADKALYRSKTQGKNKVYLYEPAS